VVLKPTGDDPVLLNALAGVLATVAFSSTSQRCEGPSQRLGAAGALTAQMFLFFAGYLSRKCALSQVVGISNSSCEGSDSLSEVQRPIGITGPSADYGRGDRRFVADFPIR
jgi:hypothetical protein